MKKILKIQEKYNDPVTNIVLDTINIKKQALVFCNTKKGAEAQAEKISLKIISLDPNYKKIADESLKALINPTRQCKRLAQCLEKGIAFHHAGLHSKQRELIENEFRKGTIKVICCTPTLAYGLNLPSFRTIVRDLKRYGHRGLTYIPTLEYHQIIGRSGRPDFNDEYGEAITIAFSEGEKDKIKEIYINGEIEKIYSKLAVEPILRTYVLSLIASEIVSDYNSLFDFFSKTFYAHQFKDIDKLKNLIGSIVAQLKEWKFIKKDKNDEKHFRNADELQKDKLEATFLGSRVSQLYIDPYTAYFIITCLERANKNTKNQTFSYLQMLSSCLELRPLLRVKTSEYDDIQAKLVEYESLLLMDEPSEYDDEEFNEFLSSIKTALFFEDWINENDEEFLLEKYNICPGEINAKLEISDWLLYSAEEFAKILNYKILIKDMVKLRFRLKYGAKEELLSLLKLKNIGRVRARALYRNKIKSIIDVKNADILILSHILGKSLAIDIKKQVGEEHDPEKIKIKENKRRGQISLNYYNE
ncbi:MAG: helicase-related protein [Candidatus Woesearchaeota archaeon]